MCTEASRGASSCPLDWLDVRSPLQKMKYLFIFIFSFRRSGVEQSKATLSSATQHVMPPEFGRSGERKVLTLGSLCLPCCVRDIA